ANPKKRLFMKALQPAEPIDGYQTGNGPSGQPLFFGLMAPSRRLCSTQARRFSTVYQSVTDERAASWALTASGGGTASAKCGNGNRSVATSARATAVSRARRIGSRPATSRRKRRRAEGRAHGRR